jgi:dTDP-4-dehydrorhamnose 3,5-epimerase
LNAVPTKLPGVIILEPRVFRDVRGYFLETWNQSVYEAVGISAPFVQDNLSFSTRGVLRGLHYQHPSAQGKLVSVVHGEVFDVAVDIRLGSPTFGQWVGVTLSSDNFRQCYVPPGFAHGFQVMSESATFSYKCTARYEPRHEGTIRWNDPDLAIDWPIRSPVLSTKDADAHGLREVAPERLPQFDGATQSA